MENINGPHLTINHFEMTRIWPFTCTAISVCIFSKYPPKYLYINQHTKHIENHNNDYYIAWNENPGLLLDKTCYAVTVNETIYGQ